MITRIVVTNFQCHRSLDVVLGPVTVILGDNGRGKSALLAALRWAALNDWRGKADAFVTFGEASSEVRLFFGEHALTRQKGRKGKVPNLYTLDGKKFAAFGGKVPGPVGRLLSLSPDNFQGQGEPYFWLGLPRPQVVRELNKIVNLDGIDHSLSVAAAGVRLARARVEVCRERHDQARDTVRRYSWTKEANERLTRLEGVAARIEAGERKQARLHAYARERRRLRLVRQNASRALQTLAKATATAEEILALEVREAKVRQALALLEEHAKLAAELRRIDTKLTNMLKICPLCGRGDT